MLVEDDGTPVTLLPSDHAAAPFETASGSRRSIVSLNSASMSPEHIETDIRTRVESLKLAWRDFLEVHVAFGRVTFSNTLDALFSQISTAPALEPAAVLAMLGRALYLNRHIEGASRFLAKARQLQPGDPLVQSLLRRIAVEFRGCRLRAQASGAAAA